MTVTVSDHRCLTGIAGTVSRDRSVLLTARLFQPIPSHLIPLLIADSLNNSWYVVCVCVCMCVCVFF